MIVHFVCEGNTFRSRLAEAYLNSKKIKMLTAVSSGIGADKNKNGTITWYAQRILLYNSLLPFVNPTWHQTTQENLQRSDLIVFLNRKNYDALVYKLHFTPKQYLIWDVKDLWEYGFSIENNSIEDDTKRITVSDQIYQKIRKKVDELVKAYS